jgi:hypothetical protein
MTNRSIDYISADFVIDANSDVWLIEANSIAVGAPLSDAGFFDHLLYDIQRHREIHNLLIVLPDSLDRLLTRVPSKTEIEQVALDLRLAGFIQAAAHDIVRITDAAERLHIACELSSAKNPNKLALYDSPNVCVLWFSKEAAPFQLAPVINRSSIRSILDDKLLFCRLISSVSTKSFSIPVTLGVSLPNRSRNLGPPKSGQVIRKPRFGTGSKDLTRARFRDWSSEATFDKYVLQEWIEPARIAWKRFEYYYDVRCIGWTGSNSPGLFLRVCAFPLALLSSGSDCAWLPTLGQMHEWYELAESQFVGPTHVEVRIAIEGAFQALLSAVNSWPDAITTSQAPK